MTRHFLLTLFALLCVSGNLAAQPRLAIISEPGTSSEADLLTSRATALGVLLVERNEIEKVAQEMATHANDVAYLGKILHADALIFLAIRKIDNRDILITSISTTHAGVRAGCWFDALPLPEVSEWSDRISAALQAILPKLAVSRKEAVPLSVLSIRAILDTEQTRRLESQVTFLLMQRLHRQKEFFLLEREKLDLLKKEKMFSPEEEPFWASSRILDGELTSAGDSLSLVLKVEAGNGQDQKVTATASTPAELVEKTVVALAREMGREPTEIDWLPQAEGVRFYREAVSADSAGLWETALASAETAAALGLDSEELDKMRIRLNARKSIPAVFQQNSRVKPAKLKLEDCSPQHAITAMELVLQRAGSISKPVRGWSQDSFEEISYRAIEAASRTLFVLSRVDLKSAKLPPGLPSLDRRDARLEFQLLRQKTRAAVDQLFEHSADGRTGLHQIAVIYAPLWEDNPEALFRRYRASLDARLNDSIHQIFWLRYLFAYDRDGSRKAGPDPTKVPWILEGAGKWEEFVQALLQAPRLQDRLDGLLIRYCSTEMPERAAWAHEIELELLRSRVDIFRDRLTTGQAIALLEVLSLERQLHEKNADPKPLAKLKVEMLLSYFEACAPFEEVMLSLVTGDSKYLEKSDAERILRAATIYEERTNATGKWQALSDLRDLNAHRNSLLKQFPELATAPEKLVNVQQFWPSEKWFSEIVHQVYYRQNALWILCTERGRLLAVEFDLDQWKVTSTIECPKPKTTSSSQYESIDFDLDADALVIAGSGTVSRLDRKSGQWQSIQAPADIPLIRLCRGKIYYAYPRATEYTRRSCDASGILMIDPAGMQVETIASSRRKESGSSLDNTKPYTVTSIVDGPDDQIVVTLRLEQDAWTPHRTLTKVMTFTPATRTWTDPFPDILQGWDGALAIETVGGILLQPHHFYVRDWAYLWEFGKQPQPVLSQPPDPVRHGFTTSDMKRRIELSGDAPTLCSVHPGEFWLLSFEKGEEFGQPGRLYHFTDREPEMFTLTYATTPESGITAAFSTALIATPQGMVIHGGVHQPDRKAAFWFIPKKDLPSSR